MKKCSYCDQPGVLTKEHIWPSNIIKKYETKLASYNKKLDKFVYSDPVIKDVCAHCNNILLSKLDAYLSNLYDQYLHQCLNSGDSAKLSFDYEMLLRVLLKISFNSARAFSSEEVLKAHKKFATFILNGGYVAGVQLRLLVVTSAKIIANGELLDTAFPVTQLRCADIAYDGDLSHRFIVRLIAINSFWFYLIISKKQENHDKWKKFINGFSAWKIQSGIHIKPAMKDIDIPVNKTTFMTPVLVDTLMRAFQNS